MSVYAKSINKIINAKQGKDIDPGPYVTMITSNSEVFYVPEMRYDEDCEMLKHALLQVPGIIEVTTDLETKTVKVAVDRFTVNMENVWNAILQSGVYPKVFGKIRK